MSAKCKHCGQPIAWDHYWTTWDHVHSLREMTAELCEPSKGFDGSTKAVPA